MNKQLVIVGIVILLLTVGLSGCNEQQISDQSREEKHDYTHNRYNRRNEDC